MPFTKTRDREPSDGFGKGLRTDVDDPLADFAGTPMPALVECYMAGNTIEAKFIADQLMEQGIPAIADRFEVASDSFRRSRW